VGNPRLRDLARAYADGRIGRDDYRARRAALLDELVGADDATPNDTRPDETRPGARAPTPPPGRAAASGPAAQAPPGARRGSGTGKVVLALVVVAALAGGGLYALRSGMLSGPAAPSPEAAAPAAPVPEAAPPAPAPAADPITAFLADPAWDMARLDRFVSDWRALPAPERDRLKGSPSFQYLADAIYRRQTEQTALADLGSADAKDQVRRLGAAIQAIGLDHNRR
jgi:hypothetical protein